MTTKTRREFIQTVGLLSASAAMLAACGDDPVVTPTDSGTGDGSVPRDGSTTDSGATDSGATDSGAADSGATDSGATDSGATDSGAIDSGAADSGTGTPRSIMVTIGDNHSHAWPMANLTTATIAAGDYNIMGTSPHGHTVTLTAEHVATLRTAGAQMVTVTITEPHMHAVTFMVGAA